MDSDANQSIAPARRHSRLRFSLLALLLFVTAVCLLLSWAVQPRKYVLTSLFQIGAIRPNIFGGTDSAFNEREFDLLRRTQVELIKSDYVLQAALRNPKVADLPILKSQKDPGAWLHDHLDVDFPGGSEVLAIRMHCTKGVINDYRAILDSVALAYQNEVVFAKDQETLINRDALAKTLSRISQELETKMGELQSVAKDSEKDSPAIRLRQADVDVLMEIWRKFSIALRDMDMQAEAPRRIRLIQPATAAQE